jgi:hypothetical protein
MAKGEQKGNRESKKPKKEKLKTIAAAPSQKAAGWQPSFGSGKKRNSAAADNALSRLVNAKSAPM